MNYPIVAVYKDSKMAGDAVAELKKKGYTENISVISKDEEDASIKEHTVKNEAGKEGGIAGAVVGGLAGLIVGTTAILVPGLGTLLVAGPFAALMGAAGAVGGGLIGFLIDAGISEDQARAFEDAVRRGEVLVVVTSDSGQNGKIRKILDRYQPIKIK